MAHFAKIDSDNKVTQVDVVLNDIATDEQAGVDFLNALYGTSDVWKKTSYNTYNNTHLLDGTPFRKNFASVGYTYDSGRDAFIPPKPSYWPAADTAEGETQTEIVCNSWTLVEDTCQWEAPIPYPDDGQMYMWDESTHQENNSLGWMLVG